MITEKKWFAVYTRPRWEKKVAEVLSKKGVEVFCPLNKVVRQWSDRKKTIQEPLFSAYVFVHTTCSQHTAIRQTDGVINLVYWLGNPAVIRDEEIDAIKLFVLEHTNVQLEKIAVNVSDRVRITDGVFMHREGDVLEVKSKTVKLFLPSLGYTITAEVGRERIEVLNYKKGVYPTASYNGMKAV